MSFLTRRPRKKRISCPRCIQPLTKQERERQRIKLLKQEARQTILREKQIENIRASEEEQKIISQAKLNAISSRCFRTKNGGRVCRGSDNLFVSPKEFGNNIDKFITETGPKALGSGVLLAGIALGGAVPIAIVAAGTGISKGASFGSSGFGPGQDEAGGISREQEQRQINQRLEALRQQKLRRKFKKKRGL